jgi:hypothetical protein
MDIVKKMLLVFKKHHITGVYGLINGDKQLNLMDLVFSKNGLKQAIIWVIIHSIILILLKLTVATI